MHKKTWKITNHGLAFRTFTTAISAMLWSTGAIGEDDTDGTELARSAAPSFVTDNATITDFEGNRIVQGSNGYVCGPGPKENPAPSCQDAGWQAFMNAFYSGQEAPSVQAISIGYWMQGVDPMRNDLPPNAPPSDQAEFFDGRPHIGLLVPNPIILEGLPTSPAEGKPWVMWAGTPWQHIMIVVGEPNKSPH